MRTSPALAAAFLLAALAGWAGEAKNDPEPAKPELLKARDGLKNVYAKLKAGKEVRVACFGGSITAANGWRVKTLKWFQTAYPSAAEKPAAPPFPYLLTTAQAMDPAECRAKALAAEKAGDDAAALLAWERVIDRCPSTKEQRTEARARIKDLRPKVPRNADPAKAHPWKTLVVVFRKLEFAWTDAKGNAVEVKKTVSEADEKKIRSSVEAFGAHVFQLSGGLLRVDADVQVVDEPLTKLHGKGAGPFTPAPHLLRPSIDPFLKDTTYDTVIAYVKYNGDQGPSVPAPFVAATFGSIDDMKGAGFIMVPWHTNYPFQGEANGEMEIHEWLHQVDWMFTHVLKYPDAVVPSSDSGRMEGDNRPGGDPEYARKKTETSWMGLYRHIMEDHVTRQMWWEAAQRLPAGQAAPGEACKPK